jgi:hypothetical protein
MFLVVCAKPAILRNARMGRVVVPAVEAGADLQLAGRAQSEHIPLGYNRGVIAWQRRGANPSGAVTWLATLNKLENRR